MFILAHLDQHLLTWGKFSFGRENISLDNNIRDNIKYTTSRFILNSKRLCSDKKKSTSSNAKKLSDDKNIKVYCYSGYQVFLINSFYLALLVMITFI